MTPKKAYSGLAIRFHPYGSIKMHFYARKTAYYSYFEEIFIDLMLKNGIIQ